MFRITLYLFSVLLLVSCTTINQKKNFQKLEKPEKFVTAIRVLANRLFRQMENYQIEHGQLKEGKPTKTHIVIKPFVNADTGEVVTMRKAFQPSVEDIMIQEIQKSQSCLEESCRSRLCKPEETMVFSEQSCQTTKRRFENFSMERMTEESLPRAHYLMYGMVRLEPYSPKPERYYHVYVSLIDRETKTVIAIDEVWIAEKLSDLEVKPLAVYQESPLYLKDNAFEQLVYLTVAKPGTTVELPETKEAILIDAAQAYEKQDYDKALWLYGKATEWSGKNTMETYMGLYLAHLRLKNLAKAEEAFVKAVDIGAGTLNLKTKFLFKKNSTDFETANNPEEVGQYAMWLRQIGEYFNHKNYCLKIVGHSSHQGLATKVKELSLKRAKKILSLIQESLPHFKSRVEGKGFEECIMCTGSENYQDAIDRRIEFKVVDDYECQMTPLNKSSKETP